MIARLSGRVVEGQKDYVIIDVGGVGYQVHVPHSTRAALPQDGTAVTLRVHTHVREDAIVLYGFATVAELEAFERLIEVTGVGPKMALSILSVLPPDRLRQAIVEQNASALTVVPGIGKKVAARLLLELKDRFAGELAPVAAGNAHAVTGEGTVVDDAVAALLSLGYSRSEAVQAVERAGGAPSAEELLRAALRLLAKRQDVG